MGSTARSSSAGSGSIAASRRAIAPASGAGSPSYSTAVVLTQAIPPRLAIESTTRSTWSRQSRSAVIRILLRPGPLTTTAGSSAYLSTTSLTPVHHGEVGRPDDLVGAGMIGGQIDGVLGAKTRLPQGVHQPVRGQRLAAGRTHRDPVTQCERLRPQAVHAGTVSGRVHGEHLPAPRPYRATAAGAFLAPVERRAHRPGRADRVECTADGVGDAARPGAGNRDRQPRDPAGQADIGLRSPGRRRRRWRRCRRHPSAPPRADPPEGGSPCVARQGCAQHTAAERCSTRRPRHRRCW